MTTSEFTLSEEKSPPNRNGILQEYWIPLFLAIFFGLIAILHIDGLKFMNQQFGREEYSHGYLIPLISIFLILQKNPLFENLLPKNRFAGVFVLALGFILFVFGELSSIYTIINYSLIVSVVGLAIIVLGTNGTKLISVPLVYLIFLVPFPEFIYHKLSSELQLISSGIGVTILRWVDVTVFLEGNIIDLGKFQLQVVDACSGLRYLFPLMSFGFLVAYLYKCPTWQKVIIFLSTIPITILMNSFRIAVVGITVENWGIAAAEGFLHDFEGWVVFMACLAILTLEIWIFHKLSGDSGHFRDKLNVSLPNPIFSQKYKNKINLPIKLVITTLVMSVITILLTTLMFNHRSQDENVPWRANFNAFPLIHSGWWGTKSNIDVDIVNVLQFSDYFLADYTHRNNNEKINLYIAYYDSQRKGASIHSPGTCIPSGGWEIVDISKVVLDEVPSTYGEPLAVNKTIIQKGKHKSVVYYWFQQRGKIITNEYMAKWYIFWDSLTQNRTDGALVRVTKFLSDSETVEDADAEMQEFLRDFTPLFVDYIPN